ncbi:unnamed protein product, partial [Effrenium voratum]
VPSRPLGSGVELESQVVQLRNCLETLERRLEEELRSFLAISDKRLQVREEQLRGVGETLQASADAALEQLGRRVDVRLRELERAGMAPMALDEVWDCIKRLQNDCQDLDSKLRRATSTDEIAERFQEMERAQAQRLEDRLATQERRLSDYRVQLQGSNREFLQAIEHRCEMLEKNFWEGQSDRGDVVEAVFKRLAEAAPIRELHDEKINSSNYDKEVQRSRLAAAEAKLSKFAALESKVDFMESQMSQQLEEQAQQFRNVGELQQRLVQKLSATEASCQRVEAQGSVLQAKLQAQMEEDRDRHSSSFESMQLRLVQRLEEVEGRSSRYATRSEKDLVDNMTALAQKISEDNAAAQRQADKRLHSIEERCDQVVQMARVQMERGVQDLKVEAEATKNALEMDLHRAERFMQEMGSKISSQEAQLLRMSEMDVQRSRLETLESKVNEVQGEQRTLRDVKAIVDAHKLQADRRHGDLEISMTSLEEQLRGREQRRSNDVEEQRARYEGLESRLTEVQVGQVRQNTTLENLTATLTNLEPKTVGQIADMARLEQAILVLQRQQRKDEDERRKKEEEQDAREIAAQKKREQEQRMRDDEQRRKEADEKNRKEAEEARIKEAEEAEAEEKKRKEAEAQKKREAEEQMRKEAEEQERREAMEAEEQRKRQEAEEAEEARQAQQKAQEAKQKQLEAARAAAGVVQPKEHTPTSQAGAPKPGFEKRRARVTGLPPTARASARSKEEEIKKVFAAIDTTSSGALTLDDLQSFLCDFLGFGQAEVAAFHQRFGEGDAMSLEGFKKGYASLNPFTLTKRHKELIIRKSGSLSSAGLQALQLEELEDSEVYVCELTNTAYVDVCKRCAILIGPSETSVFVRDCEDCVFWIAAQQLRTRDCKRCSFFLYSKTEPVIESSEDLAFAPWSASYPCSKAHFEKLGFNPEKNLWNAIYDFSGKVGKCNWRILGLEETARLQIELEDPPPKPEPENPAAPLTYEALCAEPLESGESCGTSVGQIPQTRPALPAAPPMDFKEVQQIVVQDGGKLAALEQLVRLRRKDSSSQPSTPGALAMATLAGKTLMKAGGGSAEMEAVAKATPASASSALGMARLAGQTLMEAGGGSAETEAVAKATPASASSALGMARLAGQTLMEAGGGSAETEAVAKATPASASSALGMARLAGQTLMEAGTTVHGTMAVEEEDSSGDSPRPAPSKAPKPAAKPAAKPDAAQVRKLLGESSDEESEEAKPSTAPSASAALPKLSLGKAMPKPAVNRAHPVAVDSEEDDDSDIEEAMKKAAAAASASRTSPLGGSSAAKSAPTSLRLSPQSRAEASVPVVDDEDDDSGNDFDEDIDLPM